MTEATGEDKQAVGLYDRPLVVEGKRKRKSIDSFAISHEPKRPTSAYKGGVGVKLGDVARIEHFISRSTASDLRVLHRLCFDRPGNKSEIKKNLRSFSGFPFDKESDQYARKRASLAKFTKSGLRQFLQVLDLSLSGSKEEQIEKILEFLLEPQDSGRALPRKKHRKSSSSGHKSSTGGARKKAKQSTSEDDQDLEEEEEEEQSVDDEKTDSEADNTEEDKEEAKDQTGDNKDETQQDEESPKDSQLYYDVQDVLKGADLESVTINSVCQQIFDKYPGVDLTKRREYIKSCIEKVLASS